MVLIENARQYAIEAAEAAEVRRLAEAAQAAEEAAQAAEEATQAAEEATRSKAEDDAVPVEVPADESNEEAASGPEAQEEEQ